MEMRLNSRTEAIARGPWWRRVSVAGAFGWQGLSLVLAAGVVLCWPELFLFSKVVYLPEWVRPLPDPLLAAWLLLLGPLALALPGEPKFRTALGRIVALAFLGPGIGVVIHCLFGNSGWMNALFQLAWVFVLCSLPPAVVLAGVAALRARKLMQASAGIK